ncbi:outer membrane beta-barrel protein [Flavobacterium sp. 22076]|jgi:opacity protein-like surface antigen|uniref:outer membrane beta-barrel protein n=1 Tax=unclassified Flavobacterium TaxID=196869 RepID=UPI0032025906
MKKYSLLLAVFLSAIGMQAQDARSFSLNLYGGYVFSDKVEYDNSYGYVEDGFEYGAGLEYFFMQNSSIELKYNRLDTKLPLYGPLGTQLNAGDDKGAINYILADYAHYFDTGTNLLPYLGAGAGVAILETPQSGNGTYFAWEIKGGVKIKTASSVSINLNAYLQSVTAAVGDSYYWTYYGIVGVTDYVSTYQFGLGATLSFNFKN